MTSGCTNVGVQPDNEVGASPAALRGHQWRFGMEASKREKATGAMFVKVGLMGGRNLFKGKHLTSQAGGGGVAPLWGEENLEAEL